EQQGQKCGKCPFHNVASCHFWPAYQLLVSELHQAGRVYKSFIISAYKKSPPLTSGGDLRSFNVSEAVVLGFELALEGAQPACDVVTGLIEALLHLLKQETGT